MAGDINTMLEGETPDERVVKKVKNKSKNTPVAEPKAAASGGTVHIRILTNERMIADGKARHRDDQFEATEATAKDLIAKNWAIETPRRG